MIHDQSGIEEIDSTSLTTAREIRKSRESPTTTFRYDGGSCKNFNLDFCFAQYSPPSLYQIPAFIFSPTTKPIVAISAARINRPYAVSVLKKHVWLCNPRAAEQVELRNEWMNTFEGLTLTSQTQ